MKKLLLLLVLAGIFFSCSSEEIVPEFKCECNFIVTRSILETTIKPEGNTSIFIERNKEISNYPDPEPDCNNERTIDTEYEAPGIVTHADGRRTTTETWTYYNYTCKQTRVN